MNFTARKLGLRPRQTIAEASAAVASLKVEALPRQRVLAELEGIAEVALAFGSPVSFEVPDTVWVDITGTIHLFDTERALAAELVSAVRSLGHTARVSVAGGPWLARAFARYASFDETGVFSTDSEALGGRVDSLPIVALPIDEDTVTWFAKLGLLTLGDLRSLPRPALVSRIDGRWGLRENTLFERRGPQSDGRTDAKLTGIQLGPLVDLIRGDDTSVLIPHQPREMPLEELSWDHSIDNVEPLLFVLKGLTTRLAARLEGRGQAAAELRLVIHHERPVFAASRHLERPSDNDGTPPFAQTLDLSLAIPLAHAEDLERVVRSRLQRERLIAPALGISLQARALTCAHHWQMGLIGSAVNVSADPRILTVLVAELAADLGGDAVGVLSIKDSHLLENESCLLPAGLDPHVSNREKPSHAWSFSGNARGQRRALDLEWAGASLPTRLLPVPLELTAPIDENELWLLQERLFVLESISFEERLEAVEWWNTPVSRDYYRVWISPIENGGASGGMRVLAYVDRFTGKSYVQAIYD